jgi:hypothetical protein
LAKLLRIMQGIGKKYNNIGLEFVSFPYCYLCYCPDQQKDKLIAGQTMWLCQKYNQ